MINKDEILSDSDALMRLVCIDKLRLADVGCGDGWLSMELATRAENVMAIEPDPQQAEINKKSLTDKNISFHQAGAQSLPLNTGSIDGAIFCYSFHHVPINLMPKALEEAKRVLKSTGFLYVAEPLLTGNYQQVIAPFHDETIVRGKAQENLLKAKQHLFSQHETFTYIQQTLYQSFAEFVNDMAPLSYNTDYQRADIETEEVKEIFESQRVGDHYRLLQPVKVDIFRQPVE